MLVRGATGLGPVNIQENNYSGAKSPQITSNSTRPSTDWPGGWENKVNLRDSIAATGLVILPKLDPNPFFTSVTLQFDGWPRNTIGNIFLALRSSVCHFVALRSLELESPTENAQIWAKSLAFHPVWPWNLTDESQSGNAPIGSKSAIYCPVRP